MAFRKVPNPSVISSARNLSLLTALALAQWSGAGLPVNRDTVQYQARLLFGTPPQATWHIPSAVCDSKQRSPSDIVCDVVKCLMVAFDLGTGGLSHRYPTLYGQRITVECSLIEQFWFLVQLHLLIMNGFALVLEDLGDFPFALFPAMTFLLARAIS